MELKLSASSLSDRLQNGFHFIDQAKYQAAFEHFSKYQEGQIFLDDLHPSFFTFSMY